MQKEITDNRLYSIKEAMDILRLSRMTLYNLRKNNQIGFVSFGKEIKFAPKHINDLIRKKESGKKAYQTEAFI